MHLAGDIGGTKTNLALFDDSGVEFSHLCSFSSRSYPDLRSIVLEYLRKLEGIKIERACFAIAGPVKEGVCKATNLPWVVDAKELAKATGFPQVHLINDLEANAYSLDVLKAEHLFPLFTPPHMVKGNRAVISPGTGLGEAGLYWDGKQHHPFAGEGGHCEFGPKNALEIELAHYLVDRFHHPSYERILSGPGIHTLFDFFVQIKKREVSSSILEEIQHEDPSAVISKHGLKGTCPVCVEVLELFVSVLGSEAGNCALKFMAFGGIYLGGGIPPKILPMLKNPHFLEGFLQKGRLKEVLLSIPVFVILDDKASLRGANHYLEKKESVRL